MIPAIAAHAVHHLLSQIVKPQQTSPFAVPQSQDSSTQTGAGGVVGDLGKLGSDLLNLLGLGGADASKPQQGAQAYAQATSLGR